MSFSNIVNQVAYLRTTREFPEKLEELVVQIDKAYLDIAAAVNVRTIGIFAVNKPSITGEGWFLTNLKRQTLRQVYSFTTLASIAHGIPLSEVKITRAYGSFTDGINWYGIIFGSNVAIAGQRSFYIDPTNIVFLAGAGAPAFVSGLVVIEWLSQV